MNDDESVNEYESVNDASLNRSANESVNDEYESVKAKANIREGSRRP